MTGSEHLMTVLSGVFALIIGGMFASGGIGQPQYVARQWLSHYTRVEEPDPTEYQRTWENLFSRYFDPVGLAAAERTRTPVTQQLSYHLGVSVAVLALAVVIYLLTAGMLVGGTVAAYYAGIQLDPVPLFEIVVAFVVLLGFAILAHSQERASQFTAR